jgi:hypothetical protein
VDNGSWSSAQLQWVMLFDGVGDGQQQDIRGQVFDGCIDGVWQGGSAAMVAKIALNGGGSSRGLVVGSNIRRRLLDGKDVF